MQFTKAAKRLVPDQTRMQPRIADVLQAQEADKPTPVDSLVARIRQSMRDDEQPEDRGFDGALV